MSKRGDVVEFFQGDRRGRTLPHGARPLELRAGEVLPEVGLQLLSSEQPAALILQSIKANYKTQDEAAGVMGISGSLLARQFQNIDNQHLSAQRLWLLSDGFWRDLVVGVVERRQLGRVRRDVVLEGL